MRKKLLIIGMLFCLFIVFSVFQYQKRIPQFQDTPQLTGTAAAGETIKSKPWFLKAGSYRLTFRYGNTGAGNRILALSELAVDAQNRTPVPFGEAALLQMAEDETKLGVFDFTLPSDVRELTFQIVCDDGEVRVTEASCVSVELAAGNYRDAYYLAAALTVLFAGFFFLLWRAQAGAKEPAPEEDRIPEPLALLLLLGIALVAFLPFCNPFLLSGVDMTFHLTRIDGLAQGLRDGQFPVRMDFIASHFGYASPIMYPGLLLYLPALLRLAGVSMTASYLSYVFFITLLTAYLAYFSVRRMTRSTLCGVLFAMVYTLGVYRFTNVGPRAAVGEYTATAFLPLLLVGGYELLESEKPSVWPLVLGMTGVLQSHLITAASAVGVLFVYFVLNIRKLFQKPRLVALLTAVLLTALLNLWTLLPVVGWLQGPPMVSNTVKTAYEASGLFPAWLFRWMAPGYGSGNNVLNLILSGGSVAPICVGLLPTLALVTFALLALFGAKPKRELTEKLNRLSAGFAMTAVVLLFFSTAYAAAGGLSEESIFNFAQFPWRAMSLVAVFTSFVTATVFMRFTENASRTRVCLVVAAAFAACVISLAPVSDSYLQNNAVLLRGKNENYAHYADYLYRYEPELPPDVRGKRLIVETGVGITNYSYATGTLSFDFTASDAAQETRINVPRYQYPGFRAVLNGETPLELFADAYEMGYCYTVIIPAGVTAGHVSVEYVGEPYYRIGDAVSLCTLLGLAVGCLIKKKRRRNQIQPA